MSLQVMSRVFLLDVKMKFRILKKRIDLVYSTKILVDKSHETIVLNKNSRSFLRECVTLKQF